MDKSLHMIKDKLDIAIIQSELYWESPEENRNHFSKLIRTLDRKVNLIVLPEMFTTGFSMNANHLAEKMDGPTIAWMKKEAHSSSVYITGSMMIKDDNIYYNRLVWMRPNGTYTHYDKRHLFSYAGEDEVYTAGTERVIADCFGWKINLNICYDLRFPVSLRYQDDYDCIIFVANWPSKRAHHWKTLLQARAIENLSYIIACNRVGADDNGLEYAGDSAIIGPNGLLVSDPSDQNEVIYGSMDRSILIKYREDFAFSQDADDFIITN